MTIKKILLDSMKVAFVLEKDTAYQEIGIIFIRMHILLRKTLEERFYELA